MTLRELTAAMWKGRPVTPPPGIGPGDFGERDMSVIYEWCVEVVDGYGDIVDNYFADSLAQAIEWVAGVPQELGEFLLSQHHAVPWTKGGDK